MKVILHDRNIVCRVVLETDSDWSFWSDRGEGEKVANNLAVSKGQCLDFSSGTLVARDTTVMDMILNHSSQKLIPAAILVPLFGGIDSSLESDEVKNWISNLPNQDVDLTQDSCLIYSLSDYAKNLIFPKIGVVRVSDILERNFMYHEPKEETNTTESVA